MEKAFGFLGARYTFNFWNGSDDKRQYLLYKKLCDSIYYYENQESHARMGKTSDSNYLLWKKHITNAWMGIRTQTCTHTLQAHTHVIRTHVTHWNWLLYVLRSNSIILMEKWNYVFNYICINSTRYFFVLEHRKKG